MRGHRFGLFLFGAAMVFSVASAWADSPSPKPVAAGQKPGIETLVQSCTGCHGPGGISPGDIPSLAGRSEIELAEAMLTFRDGSRPATIMNRFMAAFADDDIAALAAYFSAQSPPPVTPATTSTP